MWSRETTELIMFIHTTWYFERDAISTLLFVCLNDMLVAPRGISDPNYIKAIYRNVFLYTFLKYRNYFVKEKIVGSKNTLKTFPARLYCPSLYLVVNFVEIDSLLSSAVYIHTF